MALYVGDNEISQKILLKGNVGVQLPTMSSDTEGKYLSNDGIQPVWKAQQGMPSGRYIDLTLGVSGTKYTAPANGWFSIACMGRQVRLWNSYVGNSGGETSNDIAQMVSIPATKGQTVTLQYASCSISSDWSYFRFVYAEGE